MTDLIRHLHSFRNDWASVIAAKGELNKLNNIFINVLCTVQFYRNCQYVCDIHDASNEMKWSIFYVPPVRETVSK